MFHPRTFFWSISFLWAVPLSAQLIPWSEPPALAPAETAAHLPVASAERPVVRAKKSAARAEVEIPLALPSATSALDDTLWNLFTPPATVILTSFASTDPGSVRAGTSWVGQVTQNANSITVAGTAGDDNGWGATGLALNAAPYTYLNITAQRDAGNLAPTLFFQFEDRTLRTAVLSVSTSLFAVGTPTTVQIPLGNWTVNFGANDISGWSVGGGSVGTVPLRMTFDEVIFTASAIPEPGTYALLLGVAALGTIVLRRRFGHR